MKKNNNKSQSISYKPLATIGLAFVHKLIGGGEIGADVSFEFDHRRVVGVEHGLMGGRRPRHLGGIPGRPRWFGHLMAAQ